MIGTGKSPPPMRDEVSGQTLQPSNFSCVIGKVEIDLTGCRHRGEEALRVAGERAT